MKQREAVLCKVMVFFAVVALLVVTAFGQRGVTKDRMRQDRREFDWVQFLDVLERAETPSQALESRGPVVLKISRSSLQIINAYYDTAFTLTKVETDRGLARACCVLYLRLWGADEGYERATMIWAVGPKGMSEEGAKRYWREDVRPVLLVRGLLR